MSNRVGFGDKVLGLDRLDVCGSHHVSSNSHYSRLCVRDQVI
jgi:hypothetical protein